MKIFYKKDFQRVTVELEKLQKVYDVLDKKYKYNDYNFLEEKCKFENKYLKVKKIEEEHQKLINELTKENDDLKAQIKKVNGSKGNLTRKVNELTKELEETKIKLEESMTDKYLVRKIPSGRTPKGQKAQIKSSSKQSNVIKMVKEI